MIVTVGEQLFQEGGGCHTARQVGHRYLVLDVPAHHGQPAWVHSLSAVLWVHALHYRSGPRRIPRESIPRLAGSHGMSDKAVPTRKIYREPQGVLRWHKVSGQYGETLAANVPGGVLVRSSSFQGDGTAMVFVPGAVVAKRWRVEHIEAHEDDESGEQIAEHEQWTVEVFLASQEDLSAWLVPPATNLVARVDRHLPDPDELEAYTA